MQRLTILEYKNFRYLRVMLLLAGLAIAAYVFHRPPIDPNGGTWLGYTLGIVSAGIVCLLLWLGVRKRQYRGAGVLQGWLSAHVYLGMSLIVLATLHTGFQFGWNVHTLAYFLLMSVIANGFYGLYAYLRFPRTLTENLGEDNLDTLLLKIAELDEMARLNALQLPDEINHIVYKARQDTRIGGNIFEQFSGRQKDCPTSAAVRELQNLGRNLKGTQPKLHRELYSIMLRKETLVARARKDVMLRARLGLWLYIHVPLSIALVAALIAHVVSILFYW
jgi:hypothetical protein